jgi:parallel beta-helix repeat protein
MALGGRFVYDIKLLFNHGVNMHKKILTVVGITILFLGTCITPTVAIDNVKKSYTPVSDGNTLYVGGSGEGNYSNIQDAIDNASDGDTVFVYNGTYYGNIVVNKSINLYGECKESTFIEYYLSNDVIYISVDWVNISGFSIPFGYYVGVGIYSSNNTFTGNNILFTAGIGISINSNYNIISDNNISNCEYGIYLSNSIIGNSIIGNNISDNYDGIWLVSANRNSILNNTISMNMMGAIYLEDSHCNKILHNDISRNQNAIYVRSSQYNCVNGNNFVNNDHDLGFDKSYNNTIKSNIFKDTHCCRSIKIYNSSYNYIDSNIILNGGFSGISISTNSCFNIITNNHITTGWEGIRIWINSSYNIITNNIIYNNGWGISIWEFSNNNSIYHNDFINNSEKAYDECNNSWDDGYPSGGNFWDDYNGTDADGDGIGDTPYPIPGGDNEDRYPLMEPWNLTYPVANFTYSSEESPVLFNGSSSYDFDGEIISYEWDFGDGTKGEGKVVYHKYCEVGTYDVTLTVTDDDGLTGNITKCVDVLIANIPPTLDIYGPNHGKPGVTYDYVFINTDLDKDDLMFYIKWGDNSISPWIGPLAYGESIIASHDWSEVGTYVINTTLKDFCGEWDGSTLEVTIPRIRTSSYLWYDWLLERFPLLERLLSFLLL